MGYASLITKAQNRVQSIDTARSGVRNGPGRTFRFAILRPATAVGRLRASARPPFPVSIPARFPSLGMRLQAGAAVVSPIDAIFVALTVASIIAMWLSVA